ncbi:hypothetical protein K1T71_008307 [Dendrolimus kikuchii]|uniref:Uncharacterized protein n=1 Tax=Dendrolimus kikuchii TaxID=765133 RepID=A0ACC1CWV1_9NEOP|nr:hypothetical protein K1T71_008307 [Dendrolimus kikuchii]
MPPNIVDVPFTADPENQLTEPKPGPSNGLGPGVSKNAYYLKVFQSGLNLLAHILIGSVVSVTFLFAFANGIPLSATRLHLVLCVTGYQLLMAQAILSLSPNNGWSLMYSFVDKRRAHWILQIAGSGLAIAGSFIKILDKDIHWNTYHGQFALVALVFTSVCLVNGLASLWAYEVAKFIPPNLSKLTHICFGTVAFAAASITLCYGFDKGSFRSWLADYVAEVMISFTAILTFIVIVNPLITFSTKVRGVVRR